MGAVSICYLSILGLIAYNLIKRALDYLFPERVLFLMFLSECVGNGKTKFIKELRLILKNGTSDSGKDRFAVGDYKKMPNEVGGMDTALPEETVDKMKMLLAEHNSKQEKALEDNLKRFYYRGLKEWNAVNHNNMVCIVC